MQDHICPRCGTAFRGVTRITGLVCRPCMKTADDWQDLAPTKPRIIIPLSVLTAAQPE